MKIRFMLVRISSLLLAIVIILAVPIEGITITKANNWAKYAEEGRIENNLASTRSYYTNSNSIPIVRVDGRQIIDAYGNSIKLKGFSLWNVDIFARNPSITLEEMKQIRGWGFNTINIVPLWGANIEPYEDKPRVYNEKNLEKLEEVIKRANRVGLYVILSMAIHYGDNDNPHPYWQGWPEADYLILDSEVKQRFYDMWEMYVQRYEVYSNVIGYCWWNFPWHEPPWNERVIEEVDFYYNEFVPHMIELTRRHSNKIIFFSPYKQGSHSLLPNEKGYNLRDSGEYYYIKPIDDVNVVYCHGFHRPNYVERQIIYDDEGNRIPWDYNVEYQEKMLEPGVNFSKKYNVPMMISEFGLCVENWPDIKETGDIAQDRLDCFNVKLSLLDQYGYNWVYYLYTIGSRSGVLKPNGGKTGSIELGNIEPYKIVDVLIMYNKLT